MKLEILPEHPIYRIIEGTIVSLFIFVLIHIDSGDLMKSGIIVTQTVFLAGYVEYMFKTPWPRLVLPISMASLAYLAAKMIEGTVSAQIYPWIIVTYGIAVFILYHAISRMLGIFLWERKGRFRIIYEDLSIDMAFFLVSVSTLTFILILEHAVRTPYGLGLVVAMYAIWFVSPFVIRGQIVNSLLRGEGSILGYAHPREPEIEKLHMSLSSMIVLASMVIPLLFAYTSPTLIKRAFVPLVLLGVYEVIVLALFVTAYILIMHGALLESYLGDKMYNIENYRVFGGWRDIAWYLNRSAGYYLRMKYLSALYMLFQGLEILSLRIGDKSIYFGPIYDLLNEGLEELKKNRLASRYAFWNIINSTLELFTPDKLYIVEPNWLPVTGTGYEEQLRRAMGSIVNLYCKLHEVPREASREAEILLRHSLEKLVQLRGRARKKVREYIDQLIDQIDQLLAKERITIEDLKPFIIKQPLTINMLRNYLVHGQLFKNALVYMDNRVQADRIMEKPGTLYTLYILLLFTSIKRAPQLITGRK